MKQRRRPAGRIFDHFDEERMYLPQIPEVRKIISMPRKLIIINTAAAPTGNVIKLSQDREERLFGD